MSAQSRIEETAPSWLDFSGADKIAHMTIYAGLALLVSWSIRQSNDNPRPWAQWVIPVLFAVFYGITDEIHQFYVPNREMDGLD